MKKVMISACEISGDLHAAKLVTELKARDSSWEFFGLGSKRLRAAGVEILADITGSSTVGFIEPLKHLPKIIKVYNLLKTALKKERPDLLIVVDGQGFNMPLLGVAKKLNIPTIYYISPQEWHWGTEDGGRKVIQKTDKILAIFKEEAEFYNRLGGDAVFVGHPLLDYARSEIGQVEFCQKLGISSQKRILAVFPGSRPQEIDLVAPILMGAARQIQQKEDVQVVISVVAERYAKKIHYLVNKVGLENVVFYEDNTYDLIANSYLSLVTSGTVTLEHAVLGTPALVVYRLSGLSYRIGKMVLGKRAEKIKYIALPNILADRWLMPEFVQESARQDNIVEIALGLLQDSRRYEEMKKGLLEVRAKMGEEGVVRRAAGEVLRVLI